MALSSGQQGTSGGRSGPQDGAFGRLLRYRYVGLALPVAVFAVLSAIGVGAWGLLVSQHRNAIVRQSDAVAEQYAIRIEEFFATRLHMAKFLCDTWAAQPAMDETSFRWLAGGLHVRFPAVRALNWVDPEGIVRWVSPLDSNWQAVGLNLRTHPVAAPTFAKAVESREPAATPLLTLAQGGRGFAVYLPLPRGGAREGFINVVFRIDEVFPALWRDQKSESFALQVSDAGKPVVRIGAREEAPTASAVTTASIADRRWQVAVSFYGPAAPGLLSGMPFALPPVIAVLLSLLVAVLLFMHLRQVAALRNRERDLRVSEARLRSFLDNSPSMVVIKGLDGRYELVNSRIEEWFGIPAEKALGCRAEDFFDAETARGLSGADDRAVATGAVQSYEHRKYFADRAEHVLVDTKFPIRDAGGHTTGVGSIVSDVTDQRRTEGQLRQIQKMEAVGNLTGGLAHDFNNLLTIILGNLQMLERRIFGDDLTMIERAIGAARRASEVTQRLLAFSRRHPLSPERVDLAALVAGLQGLLTSALGSDVTLRVDAQPNLWPSHVDQGQLESALVNLAINARDAMPDGGTLTIRLANVSTSVTGDRAVAPRPPGDMVAIVVADTGVGMPRDVLDQAIDPFFTTKPRGRGTGLGLSMVYGFVNQSGGALHIDSAPGRGTRVTLFLPRADTGAVEESAA